MNISREDLIAKYEADAAAEPRRAEAKLLHDIAEWLKERERFKHEDDDI